MIKQGSGAPEQTWHLGLLGGPIGHSLSPTLHRAALDWAGLSGDYSLIADATAADVAQAAQDLRAGRWQGLNITVPHKRLAAQLCDRVLPSVWPQAPGLQAVNTWVMQRGQLCGTNTDGSGCVDALRRAGLDLVGRRVLILGCGGATLGLIGELVAAGVVKLGVVARNTLTAKASLGPWLEVLPPDQLKVLSWSASKSMGAWDVVLQATPIGHGQTEPPSADAFAELPWDAWQKRGAVLADLVYNRHGLTWFEAVAERQGVGVDPRLLASADHEARVLPALVRANGVLRGFGLAMLAAQAARSFGWWTGITPDPVVLQDALGALPATPA